MSSDHGRRIHAAAFAGLLLAATTILVNVILLRWTLQHLTKSEAGLWILAMTLGNYILFFDLGFSPMLSRSIAMTLGRAPRREELEKLGDQVATVRWTVRSIAAAIFVLLTPFIILYEREFIFPWFIFTAGAAFNLVGGVNLALLNGLSHVATERILRILAQVLLLVFSGIALRLDGGLLGLSIAWAAQGILLRVVAGIFATSRLKLGRGRFSRAELRELWGPSLRWSITALGALLILQSGNPILAVLEGPSVLPSFESIAKMGSAIMTVGLLFATSSSPVISGLFAAGRHEEVKRVIFKNLRLGLCLSVTASIFLIAFGDDITLIWLGPGVSPGIYARAMLLTMAVLEVHHVIWASAVIATGPVPFAPWAIAAGVLNIALGFLLVPQFGLLGMAAATLLAQLVTNNWYAPQFAMRHFAISLREYFTQELISVLLITLASGVVAYIVFRIQLSHVLLSCALYTALIAPGLVWIARKK